MSVESCRPTPLLAESEDVKELPDADDDDNADDCEDSEEGGIENFNSEEADSNGSGLSSADVTDV